VASVDDLSAEAVIVPPGFAPAPRARATARS
jgi:hypothetical protein